MIVFVEMIGSSEVLNFTCDFAAACFSGQDGRTVLAMAALGGQLEVVKFLVGQGADIQAKDNVS